MSNIELLPYVFQSHEIRVQVADDEPWFVLADVCKALGIKQPSRVAERLDDDEKGVSQIHTPGGMQEMVIINESGLYAVILRSDKPQAKPFRKWVTSEVLPSIRRTGSYALAASPDFSGLERLGQLTARAIEVQVGQVREEFRAELDQRFESLPISGQQAGEVYRRVRQLGLVMGGTPNHYKAAWRQFKDRYGLAAYKDLPRMKFDEALRFVDGLIAAYSPQAPLEI